MTVNSTRPFRDFIGEAEAAIETIPATEALDLAAREDVVLVDLRDVRELEREGRIPGSMHVPRGMLEFWMHPDSPYFREAFAAPKRFVMYCNRGWRSALAVRTAQQLGLQDVAQLGGGFEAWREAGGPVEAYARKK